MIHTYKLHDGTLVIPIYYKEFEIISQSTQHNAIDLSLAQYDDILYDDCAMLFDFRNTLEDITVKQLRDKHKRKHNQICFRYKEPERMFNDYRYIHEIYLEEPDWDFSKDAYGNTCIRMTWKGIHKKQYKQDTPEHSVPFNIQRQTMTTNAPNNNNYKKLPKVSPSPKPTDKKYPVIHAEHEVFVHPPISKKKCPYCNFVNEDGSHRTRGENFSSESCDEIYITSKGTVEAVTNIHFNIQNAVSIKISYCPFCRRKL